MSTTEHGHECRTLSGKCQGNVSEFQSVWRVVTLFTGLCWSKCYRMNFYLPIYLPNLSCFVERQTGAAEAY